MAREETLKQDTQGTLLGLSTGLDLTGNDDLYIHFLLPDGVEVTFSRLGGASTDPVSDFGGATDGGSPLEGIIYVTTAPSITGIIGKVICTARVQFPGQDLLSDPPAILMISDKFDNAGGD